MYRLRERENVVLKPPSRLSGVWEVEKKHFSFLPSPSIVLHKPTGK